MSFEIIFVLLALIGMVAALIWDRMRPGMVLLTVVVVFMCAGILTPKEMLEGFSNKGMITVGLLFLVSEGIRQSGALGQLVKKLLPVQKTTIFKSQLRILPSIAFISAFLNNTPVVVIFAPIVKRWAESIKLPATKFLIPLSYVTILGGLCTLIGTSTNLVVDGMIQDAGYEGFSMQLNEIACVTFTTGKTLFFDSYKQNRQTGSFILIDPITNNTSAVGMMIALDDSQSVTDYVNGLTIDLQELKIGEEHYEAIRKVCDELQKQGCKVNLIE